MPQSVSGESFFGRFSSSARSSLASKELKATIQLLDDSETIQCEFKVSTVFLSFPSTQLAFPRFYFSLPVMQRVVRVSNSIYLTWGIDSLANYVSSCACTFVCSVFLTST